jgi:hypothetical protein
MYYNRNTGGGTQFIERFRLHLYHVRSLTPPLQITLVTSILLMIEGYFTLMFFPKGIMFYSAE